MVMTSSSILNPNAPMYVPWAYREVEDFSDEWWDLVHSSPSFRDYWLRECFSDPEDMHMDLPFPDDLFFSTLPDDSNHSSSNPSKGKEGSLDLVSLGWLKWRKPRGVAEMPRYCNKAPKIVNVRVSPRPIQQPR